MPVRDYCILQSVPYNERGSDDWIKSNSALPGGLLKSKPTWPYAFGCSATSAFFVLGVKDVHNHHPVSNHRKGLPMGLILLVILVVLLMGGLPTWGYSRGWGYGPSGILGLLLVVLIVCLLMGYIPRGF